MSLKRKDLSLSTSNSATATSSQENNDNDNCNDDGNDKVKKVLKRKKRNNDNNNNLTMSSILKSSNDSSSSSCGGDNNVTATATSVPKSDSILNLIDGKNNNSQTPKKAAASSIFHSFTPLKSTISAVSPFKNDYSAILSAKKQLQNQPNKSVNKSLLFKPSVANVFIPESPMNIKLKPSSKIRSLKQSSNDLLFKFTQEKDGDINEDKDKDMDMDMDINMDIDMDLDNNNNNMKKKTAVSSRPKLSMSTPNLSNAQNTSVEDDNQGDQVDSNNEDVSEQQLIDVMINNIEKKSLDNIEKSKVNSLLYNQVPETIHCNELPLDQSLKTQITITSPAIDFRIYNDALSDYSMLSRLIGSKNQPTSSHPAGNNDNHNHIDSEQNMKLETFLSSLIHYISPSNSIPWDIQLEIVSKDPFKVKWVEDRWKEWEMSYESLFNSYLVGSVDNFYLIHNEWSCLFMYLDGVHYAKINPTSKKMRNLLSDEGIAWTTPYLQSSHVEEETISAEMLKELKELSKKNKSSKTVAKKLDPSYYQTPRSSTIVLVTGLQDVEKLGNFFKTKLIWSNKLHSKPNDTNSNPNATSTNSTTTLSRSVQLQTLFTPRKINKPMSQQQLQNDEDLTANESQYYLLSKDVPILLSKQPFYGGTLRYNRILSNEIYTKLTVSSSQPGSNDGEKGYKIEIDGPLTPDSCKNLLELMTTHNQPYQCQQYTNETTYGFNNNSLQLGRNVIKQLQYNPNPSSFTINPVG